MMKKEKEAYFLPLLPQRQKKSCFCWTSASKAIFLGVKSLDHYSGWLKPKSEWAEGPAHDSDAGAALTAAARAVPGGCAAACSAAPSTSAHRAGLSVPRASSSHTNTSLPEEQPVNITFKQKHRHVGDSLSASGKARCTGSMQLYFVQYVITAVKAKLACKNVDPSSLNAAKLYYRLFGLSKSELPIIQLINIQREKKKNHKEMSKFK